MSYTHTTITQWPGDKDITEDIHEAIWEWQRKADLATVGDEEALIDEATAIFAIIGTRQAPAVVAERIARPSPFTADGRMDVV